MKIASATDKTDGCADQTWRWIAAALIVAAVINVIAYGVQFSNPVLTSDYWYFLDAFVREVRGGTLDILDFFVKRAGTDHAQPLKKLVLLADVQWADLDLTFETAVGLGFAVACLVVLERLLRDALPQQRADGFYAASAAALAASLLTLNVGTVFSYALVVLEFGTYLFFMLTLRAAWQSLEHGTWLSYAGCLIVLNLIADDTGLLASAVICLCCLVFAIKRHRWRCPLLVGGAALIVHASYLCASDALIPRRGAVQAINAIAGGEHISLLLARNDWLAFFTVPLASGFAHLDQLKFWIPDHLIAATWVLVAIGAAFHGMFWYRALLGKLDLVSFMAMALMLILYAYVAGILYARIAVHGAAYLNAPRYGFFYLLSNVALVLMAAAQYRHPLHSASKGRMAAALVVGTVLALQLPLSISTWSQSRYLLKYHRTMMQQLAQLATPSQETHPACVAGLLVCQYPTARRVQTIRYMQEQHLNVFSDDFRRRHAVTSPTP